MEALRGWGVSLCFVAAACVVLQFLAPKTATGRLFEILCGTVLLFSAVRPLVKVNWSEVLSFESSDSLALQTAPMQTYMYERLNGPLQEAVNREGLAALQPYGFSARQITATMDIDADGNICIHEVVVYLDADQAVQRVSIQKVLEQRFQTTVTVKEE